MSVRLMSVVVVCFAASAGAQLIGPIPPATAPTPEYVPPEKREVPVRVVVPPEVEPPAPSIVERDKSGRLRALRGTAEEAAVAAYTLDAARREKVASVAAARKLDLDRFVVQNLDKVLAARKMREKVENASAFDDLFAARDIVAALRFERLIDRLERERAITPAQRVRLDETLLNYDKARKAEIDAGAGNDPTRSAILNLRQTFADATREVFESYERQIAEFSKDFAARVSHTKLRADQSAKYLQLSWQIGLPEPGKGLVGGGVPGDQASRFFLEVLDLEQQRAVLTVGLAERGQQPSNQR